jgi:uncharacterized protein YbjQ (UPF0145 family)
MLVATTETVAGHCVHQALGQCFGVVVRSRGLGGNIMAGLRSIVGGDITEYTQMLEAARCHAADRLVRNPTMMGANAILMMRFDASEISQTMREIAACGTAVGAKLRRNNSMLRAIALLFGLALLGFGGGLALHLRTLFPALVPSGAGALILFGMLFECHRTRRLGHASPGPGWTDTGERFRDPETGALVAVFFHAGSGERRHVRLRP